MAAANVFDWKERSRSLEDLAAYRAWDVNLTGVDDPEHIQACLDDGGKTAEHACNQRCHEREHHHAAIEVHVF